MEKSNLELQDRIKHLEDVLKVQFDEAVKLKETNVKLEARIETLEAEKQVLMETLLKCAKRDVQFIKKMAALDADNDFHKGIVTTLSLVVNKTFKPE